jgi:hypothetical protein
MLRIDCPGIDSVSARFLALAMLAAAAALSTVRAQEVSPQLVACHDYATKKYLADFRQVGPRQISTDHESPTIVTVFQNHNPRFEHYVAECMKRGNRENAQ